MQQQNKGRILLDVSIGRGNVLAKIAFDEKKQVTSDQYGRTEKE